MLEGSYTFGGHHFWEDVFFYQKWRIQRNYVNKKCRLLDNWDICRKEGTFEECRKAFVEFIEAFEIPKQKGHMVVMIPGLAETKNVFKELWRAVLKKGYSAIAINYPSTQKEIAGHLRQLNFFLNHLEGVDSVSFVTNGIASVILKKLFCSNEPWRKKLRIGRIVQVNPYNHGSKLIFKLSKVKYLSFILGPMAAEMDPAIVEKLPPLPSDIESGLLFSESVWYKSAECLTCSKSDKIDLEKEKNFAGAKDVVMFPSHAGNLFNNKKIVSVIVKFLMSGKF